MRVSPGKRVLQVEVSLTLYNPSEDFRYIKYKKNTLTEDTSFRFTGFTYQ